MGESGVKGLVYTSQYFPTPGICRSKKIVPVSSPLYVDKWDDFRDLGREKAKRSSKQRKYQKLLTVANEERKVSSSK